MADSDPYGATQKSPGDLDESSANAAPASPEIEPLGHPERIGRYRIEKVLGKGGFGLVYLAHDDQLNRPVAVKVPHARLVSKPEDAEAYLTEARTVANLDHPHIVPVHDVGSTDEFPCYIVSKYVEGTNLATRLKQSRLKHSEAAELIATVAEALHYAHKQGLVHRDIKTGNILVDSDGIHTRSAAALRIARALGSPFALLGLGVVVPRPIRDAVYEWIARNRYGWFGRRDTCMTPTPDLVARFLDAGEPGPPTSEPESRTEDTA